MRIADLYKVHTFQKQNINPNNRVREPQVMTAIPIRIIDKIIGTRVRPCFW